jgi:DNA-binding transcriptional regulator YiaG
MTGATPPTPTAESQIPRGAVSVMTDLRTGAVTVRGKDGLHRIYRRVPGDRVGLVRPLSLTPIPQAPPADSVPRRPRIAAMTPEQMDEMARQVRARNLAQNKRRAPPTPEQTKRDERDAWPVDAIRAARERLDLSQNRLAQRMGINRSIIAMTERCPREEKYLHARAEMARTLWRIAQEHRIDLSSIEGAVAPGPA